MADTQQPPTSTQPRRLIALDALRGTAVLLMLLVNNIGETPSTPAHLRHSGWTGGLHLADMAFPWFVFCVGVAVPLSSSGRSSGWAQISRVLRRFLILLALGAVLDSVWDGRVEFFTVGVLQTIAISYLLVTLMSGFAVRYRLLIAAAGLMAYWLVIKYVPFPGASPGEFTAHRNLILHLNRAYLGPAGLWGLCRVVPATCLCLIGSAVGEIAKRKTISVWVKCARMLAAGVASLGLAYLWSLSLPFNKPIWTPSYVLFSAGAAMLVMAAFFAVADISGKRALTAPLVVLGANPTLLYTLPILSKELALRPLHIFTSGLIRVTIFTAVWWCFAWLLYKRRVFVKF